MQDGRVSSHVCRLHSAVLHISGVLCRRENHICETVTRGWRSVVYRTACKCFKTTCWMTFGKVARETTPELFPSYSAEHRIFPGWVSSLAAPSLCCSKGWAPGTCREGSCQQHGPHATAMTLSGCRVPARPNCAGALKRSGIDFPTWVWVQFGPGSPRSPVQMARIESHNGKGRVSWPGKIHRGA